MVEDRSTPVLCRAAKVTEAAAFQDVHGATLMLPPGAAVVEGESIGLSKRSVTVGGQGPFDMPTAEFDRLVDAGVIVPA